MMFSSLAGDTANLSFYSCFPTPKATVLLHKMLGATGVSFTSRPRLVLKSSLYELDTISSTLQPPPLHHLPQAPPAMPAEDTHIEDKGASLHFGSRIS